MTVQVSYLLRPCSLQRRESILLRPRLWTSWERSSRGSGRSPEHRGSDGIGSSPACDGGIRPPVSVLRPVSVTVPRSKHHPLFQDDRDLDSAQSCPKVLWEFVLNGAQEMIPVLREWNAAAMDVVMSAKLLSSKWVQVSQELAKGCT